MSLLTLAARNDIPRLLPLVTACQALSGIDRSEDHRRAALEALWDQDIQAAIWLIGPRLAPVGYIEVSFGFSIELGGRDALIRAFFVRDAVRGRGMGSQALQLLLPMLQQMGVKAAHMEVPPNNPRAGQLFQRAGFLPRDQYALMTCDL